MKWIKIHSLYVVCHKWVMILRYIFLALRCVSESQGSFALGINQLIVRILAFIPAPIVFGYVIDAACKLHQEDPCDLGAKRNCLEYDTDLFRLVYTRIQSNLPHPSSPLFLPPPFLSEWWVFIMTAQFFFLNKTFKV